MARVPSKKFARVNVPLLQSFPQQHHTWFEACGQPDVLGHSLLLRLNGDGDAVHLVAERRWLMLELH